MISYRPRCEYCGRFVTANSCKVVETTGFMGGDQMVYCLACFDEHGDEINDTQEEESNE